MSVFSPSPTRGEGDAEPGAAAGAASDATPVGAIFFPSSQFSARFGAQFFTASVVRREIADGEGHVVFVIACRCAKQEWEVRPAFTVAPPPERLTSSYRRSTSDVVAVVV